MPEPAGCHTLLVPRKIFPYCNVLVARTSTLSSVLRKFQYPFKNVYFHFRMFQNLAKMMIKKGFKNIYEHVFFLVNIRQVSFRWPSTQL